MADGRPVQAAGQAFSAAELERAAPPVWWSPSRRAAWHQAKAARSTDGGSGGDGPAPHDAEGDGSADGGGDGGN